MEHFAGKSTGPALNLEGVWIAAGCPRGNKWRGAANSRVEESDYHEASFDDGGDREGPRMEMETGREEIPCAGVGNRRTSPGACKVEVYSGTTDVVVLVVVFVVVVPFRVRALVDVRRRNSNVKLLADG